MPVAAIPASANPFQALSLDVSRNPVGSFTRYANQATLKTPYMA
jgi:hypothetical protein